MSSENVFLVALGAALFIVHAVVAGPLSVRIARFFARMSTPKVPGPADNAGRNVSNADEIMVASASKPVRRDRAA